jgi:hypothetical protein
MTTFKQYGNLNRLTSRYGNYFRAQVSITNGSGLVWQTLRNLTVLNEGTNYTILTNVAGDVYVSHTGVSCELVRPSKGSGQQDYSSPIP